jgi:hypothetical protein
LHGHAATDVGVAFLFHVSYSQSNQNHTNLPTITNTRFATSLAVGVVRVEAGTCMHGLLYFYSQQDCVPIAV